MNIEKKTIFFFIVLFYLFKLSLFLLIFLHMSGNFFQVSVALNAKC